MIFQVIDDKDDCYGIYTNGEFIYDRLPSSNGSTWNFSRHLLGGSYNYAFIWNDGKTLAESCPSHLRSRFEAHEKRIKAHIKSHINAKVNVQESCLFDLVPETHLKNYLEVKNEICQYIFENVEKPANYTFLSQTYETIQEIATQNLKIDWELLNHLAVKDPKARSIATRFEPSRTCVNYNMFGSKTGRLTTKPDSFPILNLKSEHKSILLPKNDWFVEFDYNGAEIRTLLSLSNKPQPNEDIHEFHMKNLYRDFGTRAKTKERFFAWLYNSSSEDYLTERYYDRQSILSSHFKNGTVYTPFGRQIESDDFHALNYLLQSSSSDNCMTQVNKIHRFLRDKKSNVAFAIHDSVIIDLDHRDRNLLPQIKEIFADTKLGQFKVGIKAGKNMGQLREFTW
tara:strand:- start:45973 stop:47163 length:1191 start_codon:yes stop_codon:yes gene_type:complete